MDEAIKEPALLDVIQRFAFRPVQDQVVVKPTEKPKRSGLIHIPETAQVTQQTKTGWVIRTGPGKQTPKGCIKCQLKPGECVIFGEFAGQELYVGNMRFLVMREEEITGVLESAFMPMNAIPESPKVLNDPSIFQRKENGPTENSND